LIKKVAHPWLIGSILGAECLTQPDFERNFILTTDASNKGIGAVLSQIDDEGAERPIAFASRQLRPAEFNHSITEKEMLGALWGIEHLDFYLYGREFDVYTDHKALEAWTVKGKLNSARIERWNERLQRYSCKMKYKPPQELEHADALSRGFSTTVATMKNEEKSKSIYIKRYFFFGIWLKSV
jgi:phospholipid-translocating ATPase